MYKIYIICTNIFTNRYSYTYVTFDINANRFLWDKVTPFGIPVVPLEHKITNGCLLLSPISIALYPRKSMASSLFKISFNVRMSVANGWSSNSINVIFQDKFGTILAIRRSVRRDTKIIRGFAMFNRCWNSSKNYKLSIYYKRQIIRSNKYNSKYNIIMLQSTYIPCTKDCTVLI